MAGEGRVFTAAALADRLGGRLIGRGDLRITGINAMEVAGAEEITFIADDRYAGRWGDSAAGAALVRAGVEPAGHDSERRALIVVPDAEIAAAEVLALFAPPRIAPPPGVDPTASVHESARLEPGVAVGPHVSIDRGCVIGADTVLYAGVRLYANVTIGPRCVLHANGVIRQGCRLGAGVELHQNVSIGADGFGYRPGPTGGLVKMPHIGSVELGDDVEIGANSCVDRAKFGVTSIGAGTKIDNLVQIAHNCRIGRSCVIAGMTAIGGSAVVGDGSALGGGVLIRDHIVVGKRVTIAADAAVMNDVPDGEAWGGSPACPARDALRQVAALRKLPAYLRSSAAAGARGGPARSSGAAAD